MASSCTGYKVYPCWMESEKETIRRERIQWEGAAKYMNRGTEACWHWVSENQNPPGLLTRSKKVSDYLDSDHTDDVKNKRLLKPDWLRKHASN